MCKSAKSELAPQRTEVFSVEEGDQHWREKEEEITTVPPVEIKGNSTVLSNTPHDSLSLDTGQDSWVSSEIMDLDVDTEVTSEQDVDMITPDSRSMKSASVGSLGKWTWNINSIILDLSTANFTDTVAIKLMTNVSSEVGKGNTKGQISSIFVRVVQQSFFKIVISYVIL